MQSILNAAAPQIVEILGLVMTGIIGWAATAARRKWGIEIEAKHRAALQSAILTGARLALAGSLTGPAAIKLILSHVQVSVPDAVVALQPSREVLENLASAKLQEAGQAIGADALRAALRKAGAL